MPSYTPSDSDALLNGITPDGPYKSTTQRKNENLIYCMNAITLVILCASIMEFKTQRLPARHLVIWLFAPIFQFLGQPTLALSLAVGHFTWVSLLQVSSKDDANLPNHEDFMRGLKLLPIQEEGEENREECMICWDSMHPLALLPCNHLACTRCLQLMATSFQTACPMCRKPLFRGPSDSLVQSLSRLTNCITMANTVLHIFEMGYRIYRRQYWNAAMCMGLMAFYVLIGKGVWEAMRADREGWWRLRPGRGEERERVGGFALALVVFLWGSYNWRRDLRET